MMKHEELLKSFLEKFPITEGTAKMPCIILLDGYTGMGKSTVAKCIQKYYPVVILNNDEVREFLGDYQDASILKNELQKYRLEKLLAHHNHCILDNCFCHNYQEKLSYIKGLGYPFYIVRIECPENVIEERLQKRKIDKHNHSIATFDDYLWMKANISRVSLSLIDFIIETDKDLDSQVLQFIHQVLEKGENYE